MKKVSLVFLLMAFVVTMNAQIEVTFDFNDYESGEPYHNLNGQDGWVTKKHTSNNTGPLMYTDYLGHFSWDGSTPEIPTPDETIGVFTHCSGTSYGESAVHDITQYGFDFSNGGIIEVECDQLRMWWGTMFGIGYDGNGDGVVIPPVCVAPQFPGQDHRLYEPIYPNEESTYPDGAVYMFMTGDHATDPYFQCGVVLPNNHLTADIEPQCSQREWARWKMSIDLDAYDGAGAVTLFVKYDINHGEWEAVPECQGVNVGLTPGSGDKFDPAMWSYIFMLNSSFCGFDNFTIRYTPGGLAAQFISFDAITDQLVYGDPITLNASATSGLPVTFELLEGPAVLNGNILSFTGEEGLVKVRASQPGDGTEWQSAPSVTRSFYVVDPNNYAPEITIRRPYEGTKVYMPNFENPVMVVLSAYIDHGNVLKFEEVKCTVDGQELILKTDYPNNPENGYWFTTWTPSGPGTYNMTASITQTGGKVTSVSNAFEVTTNFNDIVVSALNGEVVVDTNVFTNHGQYPFPTHVNAFNNINLHYMHNCVNGNCNTYDHVSNLRIKNYRGEWIELCRYITPFGVQCDDDLDVTDFTTELQGLVEFEYYSEQYGTGSGYNPTAIFEYTKGVPDYPYVHLQELWYGTYSFGDYENLCPIPTIPITFDPCVEKAKLQLTTTGHNWSDTGNGVYNTGNAAEFYTDAVHNIKINGTTAFTQPLRDVCNPNPAGCQPQNGTWTYARAGWCPGSMSRVWNFNLDNALSQGHIDLLYEFDPTYVDECHPNYPDCVTGQNNCPDCKNTSNPILRVSGKLVTYSHDYDIFMDVPTFPDVDKDPFQVTLTPNPVNDKLTITTDYEKGHAGVHIINSQGVIVRSFNMMKSATVDMKDLPAGIYMVQVLGGKMVTKKIIKN